MKLRVYRKNIKESNVLKLNNACDSSDYNTFLELCIEIHGIIEIIMSGYISMQYTK